MIVQKLKHTVRKILSGYELGILRKRALAHGYNLSLVGERLSSEIVIENYFKTDFTRNALLSYLVHPFLGEGNNHHSNYKECFVIAEILKQLGYNVDVINWDNTTFLPAKDYELVIDNHNNLQRLFLKLKSSCRKVFHATNAHWLYQNWIEYGRYLDFYQKNGVAILPPRIMPPGNSAEYCDAITMFGNTFTKETYGKHACKVHQVPISVNTFPEILEERNFAKAKYNFIWLNSLGALLKGLDIVVDAFERLPFCKLYICGDLEREKELHEIILARLERLPNIRFVGWVDLNGEVFRNLATDCAFVIGNSFSEGGAGSTVNCMAKGLVPIVSRSASLTINPDQGFYLDDNSASEIINVVNRACEVPDDKLKRMSFDVYNHVLSNHTIERFRESYKNVLLQIVKEGEQEQPVHGEQAKARLNSSVNKV